MKITVTGGSGFLGTELVSRLVALGHEVRILDLQAPDPDIANKATFIYGDITDHAVVKRAIKGSNLVYHIAAIVPIARKSRTDFISINAEGTRLVLEAAKTTGARVVFCSTSSPLYDRVRALPVTETTPQSPGYAYGRSKQAAEAICKEWRTRGMSIAIVRPRMIIGPGRLGLLQILSEWINSGARIPLIGGGTNRLQLLDITDLVAFLVLLSTAPLQIFNEDYNLGARSFSTLKDDIEHVIKRVRSSSRIVTIPRFYRPFITIGNLIGRTPLTFFHLNTIDRDFYFDTSKAENALGWSPRFSNAEGLLRSHEWYIAHKDTIPTGEGHRQKLKTIGLLTVVPAILWVYETAGRAGGWFAEFVATGFGIGKIARIAPSSHGALLSMPLVPFFLLTSWHIQAALIIGVFLIGTYLARIAEQRLEVKDARPIVIDEIASVFVTFFAIPFAKLSLPILILGFLLNRAFDIFKLFPARNAERLPHGFGIMADDMVSAIYSWLVLSTIVFLLP